MGNRDERTIDVNGISFMIWEDDLFQYVTAASNDEVKLFEAGKALRRIAGWPEVKIGPAKEMPDFYSLIGKRTLVQMKAAQAERDKAIVDIFTVIDFNTKEERYRCNECNEIFDQKDAGEGHVIWSKDDEAYFIRCPNCNKIGISEEQVVPEPQETEDAGNEDEGGSPP